jgi:hypothetical protein
MPIIIHVARWVANHAFVLTDWSLSSLKLPKSSQLGEKGSYVVLHPFLQELAVWRVAEDVDHAIFERLAVRLERPFGEPVRVRANTPAKRVRLAR